MEEYIPIKIYSSNYVVNRITSKIIKQEFIGLDGNRRERYLLGCYNQIDNHAFYFNSQALETLTQREDNSYSVSNRREQDDELILNKLLEQPEGSVLVFRILSVGTIIPLAVRTFDGWDLQPFGKWLSKEYKTILEIDESILYRKWGFRDE